MPPKLAPDELVPLATIHQYKERIYRYVISLVHDPVEAEDLTQETLLRAYRNYTSLRDVGSLLTWLYRIATHICFDYLRQCARRRPVQSDLDVDQVEAAEVETPSLLQLVEQREMSACVQHYLDNLSDSYRVVVLLHDLQGLTATEIAEAIGVSISTVKIRLHRARRKLKAALEAGCEFSYNDQGVFGCESKCMSSEEMGVEGQNVKRDSAQLYTRNQVVESDIK